MKRSRGEEVESLRKYCRQCYLQKREEKKLQQLRDDIIDEQYLFEGMELSESEYRDFTHKQQTYDIIANKIGLDVAARDEYTMPELYDDHQFGINQDKRFSVAMQRYTRDDDKQVDWDDNQFKKATLSFGSKNKTTRDGDNHHFIFEDHVDFIKASIMDGHEIALEKSKPKTSVFKALSRGQKKPTYLFFPR